MLPKEIQAAIDALPAKIKVRVDEDSMGAILVYPIDDAIQKLVGKTNEYDGRGYFYFQDSQDVHEFLMDYPGARRVIYKSDFEAFGGVKIGNRYYDVNDGAEFYIDSWEFRHMVDGQSG